MLAAGEQGRKSPITAAAASLSACLVGEHSKVVCKLVVGGEDDACSRGACNFSEGHATSDVGGTSSVAEQR